MDIPTENESILELIKADTTLSQGPWVPGVGLLDPDPCLLRSRKGFLVGVMGVPSAGIVDG